MVALRMSLYFSSKGSVRPCAAHHIVQALSLLIVLRCMAIEHRCCAADDEDEGARCQRPVIPINSHTSAKQAPSGPALALINLNFPSELL